MTKPNLTQLEKEASDRGLLLRIQVRRPLNIWSFKLVVGEITSNTKIQLLGEMKGWAYQNTKGLQLDTMKVGKNANINVGDLIWSATMAWALEETPCRRRDYWLFMMKIISMKSCNVIFIGVALIL